MVDRTTLTLTDLEAAESFREYRDSNELSTDGAVRRLLKKQEETDR